MRRQRICVFLSLALDSKLTFETSLLELVSKATRIQGVVPRARKLFDCPSVLKSGFNAYNLSIMEYCAPCEDVGGVSFEYAG